MANEIQVTAALQVTNGNFRLAKNPEGTLQFNQSVAGGGIPGEVIATTAGVDVDLSALTNEGWCRMKNLDDTNFVQFGHWDGATFYPVGRMKAGEPALFRIDPSVTLRLKADTASCRTRVEVVED